MKTLVKTTTTLNTDDTAWHVEIHAEHTQQSVFIEEILLLLKRFTKDLLI